MRRPERATPKIIDRVVTENEIRPKLRFLLSDAAKAEGRQMVRNFQRYTLSSPPKDIRFQFASIARSVAEGGYPNIAAADAIMDGVLSASIQKIADGFRQPEWVLWSSSWANALADGRPDRMKGAAMYMMERDERFSIAQIDDETALLPKTAVDAVRAGGGSNSARKEWTPKRDIATFRHYRDFIVFLNDKADGDDTVRIVEDPAVTEKYCVYLAVKPGRDGGAALVVARKGISPAARAGVTFKLDPTITAVSLAAALSKQSMMDLAKSILTPGSVDPFDVAMFAEGLKDLTKIPYADGPASGERDAPITKPPALDRDLWGMIPRTQRKDYVNAMARGLRIGIHPDDTVSELLAAA